jgi:hypothetical protein
MSRRGIFLKAGPIKMACTGKNRPLSGPGGIRDVPDAGEGSWPEATVLGFFL